MNKKKFYCTSLHLPLKLFFVDFKQTREKIARKIVSIMFCFFILILFISRFIYSFNLDGSEWLAAIVTNSKRMAYLLQNDCPRVYFVLLRQVTLVRINERIYTVSPPNAVLPDTFKRSIHNSWPILEPILTKYKVYTYIYTMYIQIDKRLDKRFCNLVNLIQIDSIRFYLNASRNAFFRFFRLSLKQ